MLENRQLVLDYRKDPKPALDGMIRKLGLTFDTPGANAADVEKLPSRL